MNEIQPSNIKYILWSDDEYYYNNSMMNRDDFRSLMSSIELDNELLVYGNTISDEGRHNSTLFYKDNSLKSYLFDGYLYTTWFIDDNNDLWVRDDTFSNGTNYFLFREFNTNNQSIINSIRYSLLTDLPTFDSDVVLDNTNELGSIIIDKLKLERSNTESVNGKFVNGEDLIYFTMLVDERLNILKADYELDTLSDVLIDGLNSWYSWDQSDLYAKNVSQIESMREYINTHDKLLKSYIEKAQINYDDPIVDISDDYDKKKIRVLEFD